MLVMINDLKVADNILSDDRDTCYYLITTWILRDLKTSYDHNGFIETLDDISSFIELQNFDVRPRNTTLSPKLHNLS